METLEVIIGIVFIFLLLSLFATIIQEFVSNVISLRGNVLLDGIMQLLEFDKKSAKEARKAIKETNNYKKLKGSYLFGQIELLPSYLSAQQLIAILGELMDSKNGKREHLKIEDLKNQIYDPVLGTCLEKIAKKKNLSDDKLMVYQKEIISRFDDLMDRASGWYKRRIQGILLIIGLGIAIILNADTFTIYKNLTNNSDDRKALLSLAEDFIENNNEAVILAASDTNKASVDSILIQDVSEMRHLVDSLIKGGIHEADSPLGLGWGENGIKQEHEESSSTSFFIFLLWKFSGWLITAFAISLGAPFWFDLLNKLVNVRIAGKKFQQSENSGQASAGGNSNLNNSLAEADQVNSETEDAMVVESGFTQDDIHPNELTSEKDQSNEETSSNHPNIIVIPKAVHLSTNRPHVTRKNRNAQAHALGEANLPFVDINEDHETKKKQLIEIVNWLDVENPSHARYQRIGEITFCNIYAHDYCFLGKAYLPRVWWKENAIRDFRRGNIPTPKWGHTVQELNANALFDWLVTYGVHFGWRRLVAGESHLSILDEIQDSANLGKACIICAKRNLQDRPGHISLVVPEHENHRAIRENGIVIHPLQSQAGAANFNFFTNRPGNTNKNWWERKGVNGFRDFGFWVND